MEFETNRIFILGSGAIGLALGINLVLNNRNVVLVRTSRDDLTETKTEIRMKNIEGKILKITIPSISLKKLSHITGVVVLTTKSYVNENIALLLKEKLINSPIIIMQNGLGVEKPFLDNGFKHVFRCILFATSQTLDTNFVQYKPIAPSPIGVIRGDPEKLKQTIRLLTTSGFEFIFEEKIKKVIWKKAIINSVFNSICPLLEIDNGIFHRNNEVMEIADKIIRECITVAEKTGINLSEGELRGQILHISKLSDGQDISTLQDLQNKRKTEIESLNIEISRIAKTFDPEPNIELTELLGNLILIKSAL